MTGSFISYRNSEITILGGSKLASAIHLEHWFRTSWCVVVHSGQNGLRNRAVNTHVNLYMLIRVQRFQFGYPYNRTFIVKSLSKWISRYRYKLRKVMIGSNFSYSVTTTALTLTGSCSNLVFW